MRANAMRKCFREDTFDPLQQTGYATQAQSATYGPSGLDAGVFPNDSDILENRVRGESESFELCDTDEEWPENPYQSEVDADVQARQPQLEAWHGAQSASSKEGQFSDPDDMAERSSMNDAPATGTTKPEQQAGGQQYPGEYSQFYSPAGNVSAGHRATLLEHRSPGCKVQASNCERPPMSERGSTSFKVLATRPTAVQLRRDQPGFFFIAEIVPNSEGASSPERMAACVNSSPERTHAYVNPPFRPMQPTSNEPQRYFQPANSGPLPMRQATSHAEAARGRGFSNDHDGIYLNAAQDHEAAKCPLKVGYPTASATKHRDDHCGDGGFVSGSRQCRGQRTKPCNANPSGKKGHRQGNQLPPFQSLLRPLLANDLQTVSAAFRTAGKISRKYVHALIVECIKASRMETAMWCVDELDRTGVRPTIIMFNTILHACAKSGNYELSLTWWERMPSLKLVPTNITYNTMINACAQARRPDDAEAMLEKMIFDGCSPCKVSFTAVIGAFANKGDALRAEKWLVRMRDMGLEGDVVIYNSFLNACAKAGAMQKASRWVARMVEEGVQLDNKTYNCIIHACARIGETDVAACWFDKMKAQGLRPDLVTFGSLINVCAKGGNAVEAERWMNMMTSECLTPNIVCYNSMLHACAMAGDGTRAQRWFDKMQQSGLEPSLSAFNSMLAAVCQTSGEQVVVAILDDMLHWQIHPNSATVRTLHAALRATRNADKHAYIRQVYCVIIRWLLQRDGKHNPQQPPLEIQCEGMPSLRLSPSSLDFVAEVVRKLRTSTDPDDVDLACGLHASFL